jgi:glycosyltransferase 2 family protein
MAKASRSQVLVTLVKVLISMALIAILLGLADISDVAQNLAIVDVGSIVIAVGLCFSQTLLAGFRWHVINLGTGGSVGRWRTMRIMFAAMFCNQVLPTSIGGDLVRIGLLNRIGVPKGRAARSVVLDRTAGLLSLLTLMAVTGMVLGEQLPATWPVHLIQSLPVVAIALVLGGLFAGNRMADAVESRLRLPWAAQLLRDSAGLLKSGASTVTILLMSYGIHTASATSVWILARGSGIEIGFFQILGFLPIVILAQLVPVTIAGWGVREGTLVTLFALSGISSAAAVAVSILWGLAIAAGAIFAGLIWALTRSSGERLPDRETVTDDSETQMP